MPAPKKNRNAVKPEDQLTKLIKAYILHRAAGYSKRSFPDCDYETIEKHLNEDVVFRPLKEELDRAEREGMKVWEEIGIKISKGELKGNAAAWIFTMKNKFPEDYKDKMETEAEVKGELTIIRKVIHSKDDQHS
jgi:hypothetical protein